MSEGDVRAPERGYDLDALHLEVGTAEDGDSVEPLQAGLAQDVDFVIVRGQQGGDAVPVPRRIAPSKANSVGRRQTGVEGTASHHQHGIPLDRAEPDPWGSFDRHDRRLPGACNHRRRSHRQVEAMQLPAVITSGR